MYASDALCRPHSYRIDSRFCNEAAGLARAQAPDAHTRTGGARGRVYAADTIPAIRARPPHERCRHVSLQTGHVKSLEIERSTGHSSLDIAATNTLGMWQFKPERLQEIADATARRRGELIVRVPVIYTM
jgi:TonB family protein